MTDVNRLEVSGLCKSFGGEFTLSNVDLTVGDGEIVALLGPSGCGKTTALRCIAGVETPDDGEITIGGEPVFGRGVSKAPEKRDVGMVYQNYAIWPHKTVYENVVFPLKFTDNVPPSAYDDRVDEVLRLMEIAELKHEPATDLSGGQQQRTALARSLVHDPDLLLMDEPLSNLDRELRTTMRYELQQLHHELGISILYVTHDQEEAFYLADRVVVMNEGKVVERGTPRQLYQQPNASFTRRFIGLSNRFPGSIETNGSDGRLVRTNLATFPLANVGHVGNEVDDGTPVTCFLRPEDVTLGQFTAGTGRVIELRGTVVAEGLLGTRYELTVRLDGLETDLIVHTEQYQEFERGDEIDLHVEPGRIQVYAGSER